MDAKVDSIVRLINIDNRISTDTYIIDASFDKRGNIYVRHTGNGSCVRVNKSRIVDHNLQPGSTMPIKVNCDEFVVMCPKCLKTQEVGYRTQIDCCGSSVNVAWDGVTDMTEQAVEKVEKVQQSLDEIKSNGEVWSKDCTFSHPTLVVRSHALIVRTADGFRKLHFNSYDGKIGKNAKAIDIEMLKSGVGENEKPYGATIKSLEDERTKLEKKGYQLETEKLV